MSLSIKACIGRFVLAMAIIFSMSFTSRVEAVSLEIFNPDWSITLTDAGYSDLLFDQRPGFVGREYLSGEWGAAVGYTVGTAGATAPVWLEKDFIFPDWTTNSNFVATTAIHDTGATNVDGNAIYSSTIANAHLEVTITYEFLDTITGIAMGDAPKSAGGAGSSVTSNRYVLKQTYGIKNISGENITNLNFFQFLHGLNSEDAIYDDRAYGGAFGTYKYDITETGFDLFSSPGFVHKDVIGFHSGVAPTAWEVGAYGIEGTDSHVFGKPGTGVHLSIEADSLSGVDGYFPSSKWVSGAQKYGFGLLNNGATTTFDVLLSIQTETTSTTVPEPATIVFLGIGLGGLGAGYIRRRFRQRKSNQKEQ